MGDLLVDDLAGQRSNHVVLPDHFVEPLRSVLAIKGLVTSH